MLWANLSVLPSWGLTVRFPRLSRFPLALLRAPALLRFGRDRFAGPGSARCGRVARPVRSKAQAPASPGLFRGTGIGKIEKFKELIRNCIGIVGV